MLEIKNISAGYGKLQILFDVSISVEKNKLTTIVGPNGSGKSTLLKTIFGLTNIYSGKIFFEGKDITNIKPHIAARMGIAYLPQVDNVFTELTIEENLRMAAYTLDTETAKERIKEMLDFFPVLQKKYKNKALYMSGGERQMLAIAMNLIRRPKLMLFDEPTGGLSPLLAEQILSTIVKLVKEFNITILLVEQNALRALEIADAAYLLVSGKVAYGGSAKDLIANSELGRLYLGLK
ncbi:MAG TPA: ABC transporter ATP-binding protein [Geobacterales bacterium]|nr:ABC transporter ATP-binding protein [Geobacterales bacterium]